MAKRDYYSVLGVAPDSQPDEIKKAYRALSKKYHPDANPDNKAEADRKMKELIEAYNVINDTQKRKEYDAQPQFKVRKSSKGTHRTRGGGETKKSKVQASTEPQSLEEKSPVLRWLKGLFAKKGGVDEQRVDPKQADVHFTLGVSMSDASSFIDQALREFKLALKFDPGHREALYNMGLMQYRMGEFKDARATFIRYSELVPNDPAAKLLIEMLQD